MSRPRVLGDTEREAAAMFRCCLGRFATGVAVVTFETPDGPRGVTINSFTSVSLRPPLILASIARSARSHDALRDTPFCVNILGAEQEQLALLFAGAPSESAVDWQHGPLAPRLPRVIAYLECRPWQSYDGGDHTLYLGEVTDFDHRRGDALGYVGGRFATISEPDLGLEYLI